LRKVLVMVIMFTLCFTMNVNTSAIGITQPTKLIAKTEPVRLTVRTKPRIMIIHKLDYHIVSAEVTGYTVSMEDCGKVDGVTASQKQISRGMVAAPQILPFGTKLEIQGKPYVVEDRGGAITLDSDGVYHIDIYFNTSSEAKAWGRQRISIKIWR